ncbi:MAG: hypothetical protein D3923_04815 [Candidatus Electrothrix sp. AR3]|nr:hypothetical protein [Candidatus Electrothrix sp. AR3]
MNNDNIERIKQIIRENEEFLEGKKRKTHLLKEFSDTIQHIKKITGKVKEFLSKKEAKNNLFRNIFQKFQARPKESLIPDTLAEDPVAEQTQWTPLRSDISGFRTHYLVEAHSARLEFRPSINLILFGFFFLFSGILVFLFVLFNLPFSGYTPKETFLLKFGSSLVPLSFAVMGGVILYLNTARIVFDKQKSLLWKGHKMSDQPFDHLRKPFNDFFTIELKRVHALQLIRSNLENSFELNLVLKDGNRVTLMSYQLGKKNSAYYAEQKRIRDDTEKLSAFLEKPLWEKGTLS